MKTIFRLLLPLLLLLTYLPPLAAAEVTGLYETEVVVADQSSSERNRVLGEALGRVMVKVSGQRTALEGSGVPAELRSAARYVQQYRYRTVAPDLERGDLGLRLWVRFDERAVVQLLERVGMPVWGQNRPVTVAWIAVEAEGQRYLLSGDLDTPLRGHLLEGATERGVAVRLPVMDGVDQAAVHIMDVWGNFADVLLPASARYQADAVLVGRIYQGSDGWVARWSLYLTQGEAAGQGETWSATYPSSEAALGEGIDGLADRLATRFSRHREIEFDERVALEVSGVTQLEEYARIAHYLEGLDPVKSVWVGKLEGDRLRFDLEVKGGGEALRQAIGLGKLIEAQPEAIGFDYPLSTQDGRMVLNYRLRQAR